jgi:hypothetical protein
MTTSAVRLHADEIGLHERVPNETDRRDVDHNSVDLGCTQTLGFGCAIGLRARATSAVGGVKTPKAHAI